MLVLIGGCILIFGGGCCLGWACSFFFGEQSVAGKRGEQMIGRFVESVVCAARRHTVKRAIRSLHRSLSELTEPGCDVDTICIRMRGNIADIEYEAAAGECRIPGVQIY